MNERFAFNEKDTLFRDTIIPYPVCVCVTTVIIVVSVCTFGGILFLKLVPGSDFQFSGGQLTKKKKTQKSV